MAWLQWNNGNAKRHSSFRGTTPNRVFSCSLQCFRLVTQLIAFYTVGIITQFIAIALYCIALGGIFRLDCAQEQRSLRYHRRYSLFGDHMLQLKRHPEAFRARHLLHSCALLIWFLRLFCFVVYRIWVRGSDWRFDKLIQAKAYNLFGWTAGGTWCFVNGFCLWPPPER
jgi:hypothetical protein